MRAWAAAVVLAIVVAVVWTARVNEGKKALALCDAALARVDLVDGIAHARAAAEARCPGCAASELGYARLYAIAKEAESKGDNTTAFAAWRAVRAASLATSVTSAASPRRERAEAELARLGKKIDAVAAASGAGASPAASEERLRAALASSEDRAPGGATYALLGLGGLVFSIAAVRYVRARGARRSDLALAASGAAVATAAALWF